MICEYCGTEVDGLPDGRETGHGDKLIIHGPARCRNALKAQLATAVEGLREIAGRALSYAGWAAECARSTLRALGIVCPKDRRPMPGDESKEDIAKIIAWLRAKPDAPDYVHDHNMHLADAIERGDWR